MRCKYCHNRDTWDLHGGKEISVEDLMKEVVSYRHFMNASGGGVTASGGEAVLQAEFVRDWFRACKKEGINTCLDTNGFVRHYDEVIDELLEVTDLVLLDLKELNDRVHQNLIGVPNKRTLEFARYLQKRNQRVWVRYVVVPGWTDSDEDVHLLGQFIQDMKNIEKVELLPYHRLGAHKWEAMGKNMNLKMLNPRQKNLLSI
ncbi:Putative Pyruvate formate-lyase 1-activating enzyme [Avibacterium paragallinarum JF4211]|nr:Putative Pyruvate formate-lyase 1-activating enzyme [Avibacterium paragallinarum JF4211]